MKQRSNLPGKQNEAVAGNGLLHRRALLSRSAAIAGLAGTALGAAPTGATAEQLLEQPWGLQIGEDTPAYQTPSKFAKNVVRTLANPNFEPRSSISRRPTGTSTSLPMA
jgi:sulfane dehydrogenase subunit SoxC